MDVLAEVKRIVLLGLSGYEANVYLHGSWAKGVPARSSDIDVAVLPASPLPAGVLRNIREALEESTVPYSVDLVDLSGADEAFKERVLSEGVSWTAFANA